MNLASLLLAIWRSGIMFSAPTPTTPGAVQTGSGGMIGRISTLGRLIVNVPVQTWMENGVCEDSCKEPWI